MMQCLIREIEGEEGERMGRSVDMEKEERAGCVFGVQQLASMSAPLFRRQELRYGARVEGEETERGSGFRAGVRRQNRRISRAVASGRNSKVSVKCSLGLELLLLQH